MVNLLFVPADVLLQVNHLALVRTEIYAAKILLVRCQPPQSQEQHHVIIIQKILYVPGLEEFPLRDN